MGKRNGFVIVIKRSDKGDSRKARVTLACERGGTYRHAKNKSNVEDLNRKGTGTKKCDCPFKIIGVKLTSSDDWSVKVVCGFHNHRAAKQLEGHSYAGRLSDGEKTILSDMTKNLVKPRNILLSIKNHDEYNVSTMKTIYNARHKHRLLNSAGRSQMQQLMKQLNECKYVEWHRKDESNDCVRDLFWAHPTSIQLLNAFCSVLIMDCTYKTNRYRLPLLEIVGVTSTNLTFSVAFVYLEAERVDNYTWAIEKLQSLMFADRLPNVIVTDRELALMNVVRLVFPTTTNLLCRWHISKNVLGNCKKFFERKDKWEAFMLAWSVLVFSSKEDDYERNLRSLTTDYYTYPGVVKYVTESWLTPYKERFVAAWTNKVMHLGNVTTNRYVN